MKKMRLSFSLLAIGLALIGLPGCKKQADSPQPQAEKRWLKITYKGDSTWPISDSNNITGWKLGEETVYLWNVERGFPDVWVGLYYPWQGEDSIDYTYDAEGFLWVNGKLVGGYYSELCLLPDSILKNILTIEADYNYYNHIFERFDPQRALSIDALKRLPKLSVISADINWWEVQRDRAINTLKMISPGIDVYLTYGSHSWEDIGYLAEIKGLRSLNLWCYGMPPRDILKLAKVENLKRVHFLRGVECRLLPFLQAFLLGLVRPDCEIEMPGRRR
ncbi:hypothetical protein KAX06_04845 [candidate division WOR-3 bacterium]|nr:hypothetical protein [candidate division WOR-3 bacterium]